MTLIRSGCRALLVALAVLGCLAVAGALVLQLGPPATMARLSRVSMTAAALLAALACLVRARHSASARPRETWLLFAGAGLAWGTGSLFECYFEIGSGQPLTSPSVADLGYLLSGPLLVAGLLHLVAPDGGPAARLRALVDGLTISTAVLLVGWVTVIGPTFRSGTGDLAQRILLLAYPAIDVALISLALIVVMRTRGQGLRTPLPVEFLALAAISFGIADGAYAYLSLVDGYRDGYLVDAGLMVGFTLVLVSAILRPRAGRAGRAIVLPQHLGLLLPYFFIVVATAVSVIVTQVTGHTDAVSPWLRSALITLMVVRQLLALRENEQLTRTLEERVVERTRELEHSRQLFQALVENSSDVVSLLDRDGQIHYTSQSLLRVLGVPPEMVDGTNLREHLDEASWERMSEALTALTATPLGNTVLEITAILPTDGRRVTLESTVTNLLDDPAVRAFVFNSRDITERRRLEDELLHQAFHDPLTGLANRALFLDRVRHAAGQRADDGQSLAVLFLDLDGFKEVNDSLGHAAGDALLVEVAHRLTGCLRPGDTIARLGGDEFAVLVEGARAGTEFLPTAHRIREALEAAILVEGRELFIRASIGIAGAQVGTVDADQLIRNADLAMYQAKARQDGEPALYDPSMHSNLVERLELESELRRAVADDQLTVYYQPTYVLASGDLVGVEALVRWSHPVRGMIAPDVFIPAAEQTGLIHEVGRFVLREACFQGQQWALNTPATPMTVGVNVSGKQLQRADFADEVRQALADSGLPADRLVLEMTESVLMNDTDSTLATLQAVKQLGVRVAIDDFGTGYSSLSYLHRFPVDILKIDRSFVERLSGVDAEDSLVESIIQLGQTLDLETIAEGIEEPDQLLALRRLGCTMAQGYHFGRPSPATTVSELVGAQAAGRGAPVGVVA